MLRFRHCSVPKASEVHFLGPDIGIEALAPILVEHECVGVIDNGAETVVDKVPSDEKAQSKPDQRNDGDPFLPWVLGCLPGMVDLALLHSPRAEVFLVLLLLMDMNGGRILRGAQRGCVERVSWGGIDAVTASVASGLERATSVWGLLWCLIW